MPDIFISSWSPRSPTWKVVPILFTWMTLTPAQNLHPPVFLRVPYNRLQYSSFIFVTYRALHTPTAPLRRWNCPSISVLAAWYCIPQTQQGCNDLTQILHYMGTPIKRPQNWNHYIYQAPSSSPGPYSNPGHLCALGLDRPLSRPRARLKTSL
jgi:hypothetical protein